MTRNTNDLDETKDWLYFALVIRPDTSTQTEAEQTFKFTVNKDVTCLNSVPYCHFYLNVRQLPSFSGLISY